MRIMYKIRVYNNSIKYNSTARYDTEQKAREAVERYNADLVLKGYRAKYLGPVYINHEGKEIKK